SNNKVITKHEININLLTPRTENFFFFQAEDGIRDRNVTGVQTCALPIFTHRYVLLCTPLRYLYGYHTPIVITFSRILLTFVGKKIGRASCRERVWISVGAVSLKKKSIVGGGTELVVSCGRGMAGGTDCDA